ncbi:sensor histidine kinase [Chitinophaga sp. HK235]|uniref:sensor histidine kinase n=1 Tax=Chitinophaga sp. HK235 TaxID=2952571 RepID=UPI001BA831A5|nr:histidine kinase [Chitinophaga sp. HK235]
MHSSHRPFLLFLLLSGICSCRQQPPSSTPAVTPVFTAAQVVGAPSVYQEYYNKGDYQNVLRILDSTSNTALSEQDEKQMWKAAAVQGLKELESRQQQMLDLSRQYNYHQQIILVLIMFLLALGIFTTLLLIRQRRLVTAKMSLELEQRLLRSQMEPHFIFNTLSVLQSFIRRDEKDKSVRYLNKFSRMLRLTLENSRHSLVPLHRETEAIENYLSLQVVRFDNVFDYTIQDIPEEDSSDICIPPMLLQPFVENAIQHGMRNIAHHGHISITLELKEDILHCIIEDNGQGLQPVKKKEKHTLSGTIVRERLKMLSHQTGKTATLTITDKQTEGRTGVRVTLMIPVQRC